MLLVPQLALPTEYGKLWIADRVTAGEKHRPVMRDIFKLALAEHWRWRRVEATLDAEGVPQMLTNGLSQYGLSHLLDHINRNTAFTQPSAFDFVMATAAPTSTTTGSTVTEAAYSGYIRVPFTVGAASAATPSVATNGSVINGGGCSGGSSTLTGFIVADNVTVGLGQSLWYGTLASVLVNTSQTPPTIAAGALSLSINDT